MASSKKEKKSPKVMQSHHNKQNLESKNKQNNLIKFI